MPLPPPIHFARWVEEHRDKLQPPVNNFLVQRGDFIIMAIGGPNARTDYHINPTDVYAPILCVRAHMLQEWFYQVKGDMLLKVVDDGVFRDIPICEGEMYLLPGNVPHNPCRFADTIGIVVERQRPAGDLGMNRI
jgi:3-hydroxyanthranilate 3,4-dioxygenase